MKPIELTQDIIYAAGHDAGNRSMRKAGRTAWSEDDLSACVREERRLLRIWKPELAALMDRDDPLD